MRLIDADELIKDDEINLWLSNNAVRTGKTLKMFSELFIKKINKQPTVQAILKTNYENRLNADMVAILTDIQLEIEELNTYDIERTHGLIEDSYVTTDVRDIIQQKINALKGNQEGKE